MDFPATPFWDFSLRVYGTKDVPAACLRLQDRHGLDVNILLFCLWLGRTDADAAALDRAIAAVSVWHDEAVRPLRAVRKHLKKGLPPVDDGLVQVVRAQIQKTEIDAEHLEQVTLWRTAGMPVETTASVDAGLAFAGHYFRHLEIAPSPDDAADLAHLVSAAYPDPGTLDPALVYRALVSG